MRKACLRKHRLRDQSKFLRPIDLDELERADSLETNQLHGGAPATFMAAKALKRYTAAAGGRGIGRLSQDFKQQVSQGSGVPPIEEEFPQKVKYPKVCGQLCLCHTPAATLAPYLSALQGFRTVAMRFSGTTSLINEDVVLAVEITPLGTQEPSRVLFVWFILMSGQSGPNPPTETFVEMKPEGPVEVGSNYNGISLRFEREAFVKMERKFRAPMHRQQLGAFRHVTEQQLAAKIATIFGDPGCRVMSFAWPIARFIPELATDRVSERFPQTYVLVIHPDWQQTVEAVLFCRVIPGRCCCTDGQWFIEFRASVLAFVADNFGARMLHTSLQARRPECEFAGWRTEL
jgi:hypothetical protein